MFPLLLLPREIQLPILQLLPLPDILTLRCLSRQAVIMVRNCAKDLRRKACDIIIQPEADGFNISIRHGPGFRKVYSKNIRKFQIVSPSRAIVRFVGYEALFTYSQPNAFIEILGKDTLGTLAWVFKNTVFNLFLHKNFKLRNCDRPSKIISYLSSEVTSLDVSKFCQDDAKSFLRAISHLTNLKRLHLLADSAVMDRELFDDHRIRQLEDFGFFTSRCYEGPSLCFDDEIFAEQRWPRMVLNPPSKVTVDGLNAVLRQWIESQREIIDFYIRIADEEENFQENFLLEPVKISNFRLYSLERADSSTLSIETFPTTGTLLGVRISSPN